MPGLTERILVAQRMVDNGPESRELDDWDQVRRTLLSLRLSQAGSSASSELEQVVSLLDEGLVRSAADLEDAVLALAG